MGPLKSESVVCPIDQKCSQWARKYMGFCICSTRDEFSLALGLISVMSWSVAEVPQIITNYSKKSADGLSMAFLLTWIIGDLFILFGCMQEPATLPTQYYMAMFVIDVYGDTLTLTTQAVYYGHIYPRLKSNKRRHEVFLVTFFLGSFNWKLSGIHQNDMKLENPTGGMVFHIGRQLLKAKEIGVSTQGTVAAESNGIGSFLGWGMAAIYLVGRLPQICLNIKKGSVEAKPTRERSYASGKSENNFMCQLAKNNIACYFTVSNKLPPHIRIDENVNIRIKVSQVFCTKEI